MSRGVSIQVEGLKQLGIVFRAAADVGLPKALRMANLEAAQVIAGGAQAKAPRRSGKLSGNIRATATQRAASVRVGGSSVPYANAVHWGTGPRPGLRGPHNITARKFLIRALDDFRGPATMVYEKALALLVREI